MVETDFKELVNGVSNLQEEFKKVVNKVDKLEKEISKNCTKLDNMDNKLVKIQSQLGGHNLTEIFEICQANGQGIEVLSNRLDKL